MLVWGRVTDFSVTTLNCPLPMARRARGEIFDRYGLGLGSWACRGRWVLGLGPAGEAGSWVLGSGPQDPCLEFIHMRHHTHQALEANRHAQYWECREVGSRARPVSLVTAE